MTSACSISSDVHTFGKKAAGGAVSRWTASITATELCCILSTRKDLPWLGLRTSCHSRWRVLFSLFSFFFRWRSLVVSNGDVCGTVVKWAGPMLYSGGSCHVVARPDSSRFLWDCNVKKVIGLTSRVTAQLSSACASKLSWCLILRSADRSIYATKARISQWSCHWNWGTACLKSKCALLGCSVSLGIRRYSCKRQITEGREKGLLDEESPG
jgi:hypothetical protein